MSFLLISTGGTIDGADSVKNTSRLSSDAAEYLRQQRVPFRHLALFNKDSRLITTEDRQRLIEAVKNSDENHVILTHGTFTICLTASVLKHAISGLDKRVLLVGAWIPFNDHGSDAPAQIEFALKNLGSNPGVFVAMDGRLWDPDRTEKIEIGPDQFRLSDRRLDTF